MDFSDNKCQRVHHSSASKVFVDALAVNLD
jgi:hypothetical protein